MYALFLVLNNINKLDNILEIFYDMKVGATTLDSVGMGKVLIGHNVEVPVFAGIRKLIEGNKPYNKTIVSVIRDENKKNKVIERLNEELDFINKPGIGFLFVVPVLECYGLNIDQKK